MKIVLTQEEKDKVVLDILCNGAIGFLRQSGVNLEYSDLEYQDLRQKGDCFEDVLMRILNQGDGLQFTDEEGDGEYSVLLTKELVSERFDTLDDADFTRNVQTILDETGDAENGLEVLQFLLYGESIFG